jgi:D-alanyl-D-alanine carboxypeptidase
VRFLAVLSARLLCVLVVCVLVAATSTAAAPRQFSITAQSYVAIDARSGRVLIEHHATTRRPIASLTKVMTALIVSERGQLDRRVLVTPSAVDVQPEVEGLVVGQRYRRITLLYSSLLVSSNDSATALAIDSGGGSLSTFYGMMNAKARAIGMAATTYASPSGLDDVHNLSTAIDQARLARYALGNPTIARIVSTRIYRTRWPGSSTARVWVNHNKMLGSTPGVFGVKTGWTTKAGGCLIVAIHRGGRDVIGVILDSASIWSDMTALLDGALAADGAR